MKRLLSGVFLWMLASVFFGGCKKESSCQSCAGGNRPPKAHAGADQSITLPTSSALLDGSGSSDPDSNITGYSWKKISGPSAGTITSPASVATTVTGMEGGTYHFELKVVDAGGLFSLDTVRILVDDPLVNQPPQAHAGADQSIAPPASSVLLDGGGSSDPENAITAYAWTKISGPASSSITQPNLVQTQVTGLTGGIYLFELKVTDAGGLFSRDTVKILVDNPVANQPPQACIGPDQIITLPEDTALLDGTCSADPENAIISYTWTRISGPASSTLSNPNSPQALAKNLVQGVYLFELKVVDGGGLSSYDTTTITVKPQPLDCTGSTRQHIPATLTPVGALSAAREQMGVASAGDKILFIGGIIPSTTTISNKVDILNTTTNTWTTHTLNHRPAIGASPVLGNKVYIPTVGPNWSTLTEVYVYDALANTWATITMPSLPGRGQYDAGVAAANKVLFVSGTQTSGPPDYTTHTIVDILDVVTNTWKTDTLSGRTYSWPYHSMSDAGISATAVGNEVYLAGNASDWKAWDFGSISPTVNVYNAVAGTWTLGPSLSIPRGYMGSIRVGSKIFWAGGVHVQGTSFTDLVEIRDVATGASTFSCLSKPNAFMSAVQYQNTIAFFTSVYNLPGQVNNRFDVYNLTNNTWMVAVLPKKVHGASIISVNNKIYVAGGYVDGQPSDKVCQLTY